MARGDRWIFRIGMAMIIAVVSAVATLWITGWTPIKVYEPPQPRSSLTENLGGKTWAQSSAEVDRRVKARFPLGMPESAMTLEIQRQGFHRNDWTYQKTGNEEAAAFRSENTIICNTGAFVYWRTDASGNLASIRAEYREMGCL
jgi:hypothetical protein